MKKLLLLASIFALLSLSVGAQGLFRPIPKDLFTANKSVLKAVETPSVWLWRISAEVTAVELIYNKETKQFDSQPLSSAGPAIGYKHFTELPDGSPYCDFGVSLACLLGTDITQVVPANIKGALLINAFQYLNVGVDYGFGNKAFGILIGASINF